MDFREQSGISVRLVEGAEWHGDGKASSNVNFRQPVSNLYIDKPIWYLMAFESFDKCSRKFPTTDQGLPISIFR